MKKEKNLNEVARGLTKNYWMVIPVRASIAFGYLFIMGLLYLTGNIRIMYFMIIPPIIFTGFLSFLLIIEKIDYVLNDFGKKYF